MNAESKTSWVPLAEVARPHGVRGELRLKVYNRDSDLLLDLEEVLVRLPDGAEHEVTVESARPADQAILMKLHSVDDRNRAEELRGALVCARREDFPPEEDGEFYVHDILGAQVSCQGVDVGTVRDIRAYPSVDVLVIVPAEGREFEVPLTDTFVSEVNASAQRVTLRTLDGIER